MMDGDIGSLLKVFTFGTQQVVVVGESMEVEVSTKSPKGGVSTHEEGTMLSSSSPMCL